MLKLDLTKDNIFAYIKHIQDGGGSDTGTPMDDTNCPLARAYRFVHPESQIVKMGVFVAEIDDTRYYYEGWQMQLMGKIDKEGVRTGINTPVATLMKMLEEVY